MFRPDCTWWMFGRWLYFADNAIGLAEVLLWPDRVRVALNNTATVASAKTKHRYSTEDSFRARKTKLVLEVSIWSWSFNYVALWLSQIRDTNWVKASCWEQHECEKYKNEYDCSLLRLEKQIAQIACVMTGLQSLENGALSLVVNICDNSITRCFSF